MREHCFGTGQPPLVVLGHSIGGHVALHAVHQVWMCGRGRGRHEPAVVWKDKRAFGCTCRHEAYDWAAVCLCGPRI
eukprot:363694-Chlamydomonas_euryale.AAC.14